MSCSDGCGGCSSEVKCTPQMRFKLSLDGKGTDQERLRKMELAINALSISVPEYVLKSFDDETKALFNPDGE